MRILIYLISTILLFSSNLNAGSS
ncbi:uncharacterized protein METZ01_LOCUS389321, partial [marine metagenome]